MDILKTSAIPDVIIELAEKVALEPTQYTNKPTVLIVGGFVRDLLSNRHTTDIDLEVYGVDELALKTILHSVFPNDVTEVGKSFGIFKTRYQNLTIDIALPRREHKISSGHTGFDIIIDPSLTITEGLRRRDFTINAMALDPLTNTMFDPYHGQEDIKTKTLRIVDSQSFIEDPLRVYRALQFAARFDLTTEPITVQLMQQMVSSGELETISRERLTEEFKKLLLAPKPSVGILLGQELGIFEKYFPEISNIGDNLTALDKGAQNLRLAECDLNTEEKIAVLIYLLCSRNRLQNTAGITTFLHKLSFNKLIETSVLNLAKHYPTIHTLVMEAADNLELEPAQINTWRQVIKQIPPMRWQLLDMVYKSVQNIQSHAISDTASPLKQIIIKYDLENAGNTLLITGQEILDVAAKMNIPISGQLIGDTINQIETMRDQGQIESKDQALAKLHGLLTNRH